MLARRLQMAAPDTTASMRHQVMTAQHKRSWLLQLICRPHELLSAREAVLKPGPPRGMRITREKALMIVRSVGHNPNPRCGVQDELVMALNALNDLDGHPMLFDRLLGV